MDTFEPDATSFPFSRRWAACVEPEELTVVEDAAAEAEADAAILDAMATGSIDPVAVLELGADTEVDPIVVPVALEDGIGAPTSWTSRTLEVAVTWAPAFDIDAEPLVDVDSTLKIVTVLVMVIVTLLVVEFSSMPTSATIAFTGVNTNVTVEFCFVEFCAISARLANNVAAAVVFDELVELRLTEELAAVVLVPSALEFQVGWSAPDVVL
jgi:hypothetical protein